MSKGMMLLCVIAGSVAAFAPPAAANAIRCDVCTTDADFRREAESAGAGTHLVYNLDANLLQQWYLGAGFDGGDPARSARPTASAAAGGALKQTPPLGASEELTRAHALHAKGGRTLNPIIVVPVAKLGLNPHASGRTAYDFVLDRNLQGMVESAAGSTDVILSFAGADVLTAISKLASVGTGDLGLKEQARLLFQIVFKDGSNVIIAVDTDHANGRYQAGSARTAAGQRISAAGEQTTS